MIILERCCLCGDLATERDGDEKFCDRHFRGETARCADMLAGFCPASIDGFCIGGFDGDDGERHCHG